MTSSAVSRGKSSIKQEVQVTSLSSASGPVPRSKEKKARKKWIPGPTTQIISLVSDDEAPPTTLPEQEVAPAGMPGGASGDTSGDVRASGDTSGDVRASGDEKASGDVRVSGDEKASGKKRASGGVAKRKRGGRDSDSDSGSLVRVKISRLINWVANTQT